MESEILEPLIKMVVQFPPNDPWAGGLLPGKVASGSIGPKRVALEETLSNPRLLSFPPGCCVDVVFLFLFLGKDGK